MAFSVKAACTPRPRCVTARAWQKVASLTELKGSPNHRVVHSTEEAGRILVQELEGEVYAVSNKCTHLGLPIQGKLVGKEVVNGCVVCPFHNTAFDVKSGECKGDWAPNFPDLPFVGKVKEAAPLKTFETRVAESGDVEVNVV